MGLAMLLLLPQHFPAESLRHFCFGKRADSLIDPFIDLPIHNHLDFKALISSVSSCELLLLLQLPTQLPVTN